MVLKGLKCSFSPIRTYCVVGTLTSAAVLVVGVMVTAGSVTVAVVPESSSSSSSLLNVNVIFVDFPPGYLYLYPCAHSIRVCLLVPNFFCHWWYDIMSFSSLLPFKVWYSWYFRTQVASITPTSALSKMPVTSSKPQMWPILEVTQAAASSTC